jgi:phosphatidyl-myo-inositol alpha-mannosyltransferase
MMNGLPVVSGDLPARRSILGNDEAGLLLPVGDAAAAATAILRLVDEPELRLRLVR